MSGCPYTHSVITNEPCTSPLTEQPYSPSVWNIQNDSAFHWEHNGAETERGRNRRWLWRIHRISKDFYWWGADGAERRIKNGNMLASLKQCDVQKHQASTKTERLWLKREAGVVWNSWWRWLKEGHVENSEGEGGWLLHGLQTSLEQSETTGFKLSTLPASPRHTYSFHISG